MNNKNDSTGRFIMLSVFTNNYKKKIKGHTLMELFTAKKKKKRKRPNLMKLFTATGKPKKFFFF
jgi:hypothetical protein